MHQIIKTRKGRFELTQIERGNWQFRILEIKGNATDGYGNKLEAEKQARAIIKALS